MVRSACCSRSPGLRQGQFAYELAFIPVEDATAGTPHRAARRPGRDHARRRTSRTSADRPFRSVTRASRWTIPTRASPAMAAPKGSLEGPLADQVAQVLAEAVNPAIASHGGRAELVSVDGTIAYLKLGGGCQGCGMAQVTLKQGIERILMESIPELTDIVDVTDHASGTDPYYQHSKK